MANRIWGLGARNEMRMAKDERKVDGYKNPRAAYCLRRRVVVGRWLDRG